MQYINGKESFDDVDGKLGSATNYTNFDTTGHQTMAGDARPWRDELADAVNLKTVGPGVSLNGSGEGTMDFVHTAQLTDYIYCNVQLNHDKDLTSRVYPHIHWFAAEESKVPNFMIQYRWQKQNSAKVTAWTDYKCNTMMTTPPGAGATVHAICGNATGIPVPSGSAISDIIQFRIIRDHDNANAAHFFTGEDPYSGTVAVLAFDVHFMINSLGSTDEYIK